MPMASSRASVRNRSSSATSCLGLAGEADDEVGPGAGLRAPLPDLARAARRNRSRSPNRRIAPQHRPAGVLERQVEVGRDAGGRGHHVDQSRAQLGGLQVADPDPGDAVDRGQLRQQLLEQPQVAQVLAVGRGVLADQQQLADALARPATRASASTSSGGAGQERAAERRDRAERAAPVAAGSDLERGRPARRRAGGAAPAARTPGRRRRAGRRHLGSRGPCAGHAGPPAAPAPLRRGDAAAAAGGPAAVCGPRARPASTASSRAPMSA